MIGAGGQRFLQRLALLALLACGGFGAAGQGFAQSPAAGPAQCAADRVDLRGPSGSHAFVVELADTPDLRAQGLMFRQEMAADAGMLFVYPGAGRAQFWMKNTLIPLDMLFIDPQGLVLKIHPRAVPGSEAVIDGGDGVKFVLELNGGRAAELGIQPGAVLRHPAIGVGALWPC